MVKKKSKKRAPRPEDGRSAAAAEGRLVARRRKRQPEEVRARILAAAFVAFAQDGYVGASLRSIAASAGITIQLLLYHVKSKEELWKLTMEETFGELERQYRTNPVPDSAPVADRLHRLVSDIVRFSARTPRMLRVMILEAGQLTPRLVWLIEHRTAWIFREFCSLAEQGQREGIVRRVPVARLYYAVISMASVPFSISAEYEYFCGKSPFSVGEVDRTIDLIDEFLFLRA